MTTDSIQSSSSNDSSKYGDAEDETSPEVDRKSKEGETANAITASSSGTTSSSSSPGQPSATATANKSSPPPTTTSSGIGISATTAVPVTSANLYANNSNSNSNSGKRPPPVQKKRPYRRTKRPKNYCDKSTVTTTTDAVNTPINVYDAVLGEAEGTYQSSNTSIECFKQTSDRIFLLNISSVQH